MSILTPETRDARATDVRWRADALTVDLSDGRSVSVPLAWFPRLQAASRRERSNWRVIGGGEGIHWPDLDEDISVEALLAGRGSMESQASLVAWLQSRRKRPSRRSAKPVRPAKARRRARAHS
jgi:hypothetical protein